MRLNQVTLPAIDVAASVAFYQCIGIKLIVDAPHYARFKSMEGDTTLIHKGRTSCSLQAHTQDRRVRRRLRHWTKRSNGFKARVCSSAKRHATNRGSGARHDLRILPATSSVSTGPVPIVSTRHGELEPDYAFVAEQRPVFVNAARSARYVSVAPLAQRSRRPKSGYSGSTECSFVPTQ